MKILMYESSCEKFLVRDQKYCMLKCSKQIMIQIQSKENKNFSSIMQNNYTCSQVRKSGNVFCDVVGLAIIYNKLRRMITIYLFPKLLKLLCMIIIYYLLYAFSFLTTQ